MLKDPRPKRPWHGTAPAAAWLLAVALGPLLAIGCYLALCRWFGIAVTRPDLILCLLVLALGLRARSLLDERWPAATLALLLGWLWMLGLLALVAHVSSSFAFFDARVLLWWALLTPLLQGLGLALARQLALRWSTRPGHRRSAVIVGAGPLGLKTAQALHGGRSRGIDFLGYFDDRSDERVRSEAAAQRLGSLKDLAPFVREQAVQEIYVTLPLGSQPRIAELLGQLHATAASVFFVPDVFGLGLVQGRLHEVNGVSAVSLCVAPFTGFGKWAKRGSDVGLAALALVLGAPLLLAIAVGVKCSLGGPVIVRQLRAAPQGNDVVAYRFRSQRAADGGATAFGDWLQRHRLDRLPQLVNVLQGRMSLVGPDCPAAQGEPYRRLLRASMVRGELKPGMTGWAQLHRTRGAAEPPDELRSRVEYDLAYLRNWSLALDLQIIARSIVWMLRGDSAPVESR